jgi:hypothetical protein
LRVTPRGDFVFFKDQTATRLCRASLLIERRAFQVYGPFRSAKVGADHEFLEKLRHGAGWASLSRIRDPLVFGLWSDSSATRSGGTESLEDGYVAPVRREYSQLIFAQHAQGFARCSDAEVDARLRAAGNYMEPCEIEELV